MTEQLLFEVTIKNVTHGAHAAAAGTGGSSILFV